MMRVTNSMIVKRSKTNINSNRANVDYTNNQMATQKKIVKPSDNPVIAIRALRLRSTLSTITQYYENNIPDTEAWMNCTETALENMKGALKDAYDQTVYGATDELNTENRQTILKSLQSLQQQIYSEGNADYAGRTIFTGYKTNQTLTFVDNVEAKNAKYNITERFSYKDITQKKYYAGSFNQTENILDPGMEAPMFEEKTLNRLRLSYDNISPSPTTLIISYENGADISQSPNAGLSSDGSAYFGPLKLTTDDIGQLAGGVNEDKTCLIVESGNNGFEIYNLEDTELENPRDPDNSNIVPKKGAKPFCYIEEISDGYRAYSLEDTKLDPTQGRIPKDTANPISIVQQTNNDGDGYLAIKIDVQDFSYRVTNTTELKESGYALEDNEIVFDAESGELIFGDTVKEALEASRASFKFQYDKKGFEEGELRPEHYFDCKKDVPDRYDPIEYVNYKDDEWMTQAIYYNIAGGQQMQINTEAREVFDSNIRRDIDDLIEVVQTAISAQDTVDRIKDKIENGGYPEGSDDLKKLNQWLDAANKQLDYANQNMHDTYSAYITKFQGYMDKVSLEVTDLGGRGERVELTKNRMSVQKSTFKELKSQNEDMELSDLVINYTAASVAYQAALQASAKIGQMTLLNYI